MNAEESNPAMIHLVRGFLEMDSRSIDSEAGELDIQYASKGFAKDGQEHGIGEIDPKTQPASLLHRLLWHGGSVYDAWLTAVSAQVGQVILSMPTSYAQMGLKLGIFFHLFYVIIGIWTCYLLAVLYVEYRHREEKKGHNFDNCVIQYHEVMGSLVGPWAKRIVLFFNIMTMSSVATVQIIACASNAYYVSSQLDKRQWTLIFGGFSTFVVLVPTLHNFRMFSFIGVFTTTYAAWYMFIATLKHGKIDGVTHSGPQNLVKFFTGMTNILYATGGHSITIEIMHAMWKPRKYKYVYLINCIYVLSITVPHCVALDWAFGDELLNHSNALSILPPSNARTTALLFMILHSMIGIGLYLIPLSLMWEKLWGMHTAWFPRRAVLRLPVAAVLWFLALLIPFFGPLNSLVGSAFMSFSTYMFPSLAYLYVFRNPESRQNAAEKTSRFLPGWKGTVALNIFVVAVIASLGTGLGIYASISNIKDQVNTFGFFQKCYQCE